MAIGYFSSYATKAIMDHVMGVTPYVAPVHLYVALSTTDPGKSGSGITEPVAMGYARVLHDDWTVGSDSVAINSSDITFAAATGVWGTISNFAIYDALTGGNMIAYGPVATSKMVQQGDTPEFYAGDFSIKLD